MNIVKKLDQLDAVRAVMQLYIDGADGDAAKLEQAFHPDAMMFGHVGETRRDMPISAFIKSVGDNGPGLCGKDYRFDLADIKIAGQAAVATLIEQDYRGCEFINFFTLAQIDGQWKIVSKTYSSTGGPFQ